MPKPKIRMHNGQWLVFYSGNICDFNKEHLDAAFAFVNRLNTRLKNA